MALTTYRGETVKFIAFQNKHVARWNTFCLQNDAAWFWHTSFRMEHALNCSFSIKSENRSFFVEQSGQTVAIVPLTIDVMNRAGSANASAIIEMNYGGMGVPAPVASEGLTEGQKQKVLSRIFSEIDKIAEEARVQRLVMRVPLTLSYCKKYTYWNYLPRYGFQDTSLSTQVVDLTQPETAIWSRFTENHKRAIKKSARFLRIDLFDHKNISQEVFKEFQSFYFKVAGKVTRPEKTFELLFYYLCHDMGVMGRAVHEGRPVGYVVAIYYKNDAYYLMGANELDFAICPVGHIVHWKLIQYLKAKGIAHYELGLQQFSSLLHDSPSEKQISISRFKRGFGGVTLPYFLGEKFYSCDYLRRVWNNRIEKYISSHDPCRTP
jgi:hypothetical protein